jgi:hypothetical protein
MVGSKGPADPSLRVLARSPRISACAVADARETVASESQQCVEPGAAQPPADLRVRPGRR